MDQRPHFLDRYDRFLSNNLRGSGPARNADRLYHRYQAIIANNFDLFRSARVLDIRSADGCWSMAALDVGACHVVGVDASRAAIEEAEEIFSEYRISPSAYQFIHSDVFTALRSMTPDAFDLVLCQDGFELLDPRVLFGYFHRLRPKHVILDTGIARGEGPVTRFTLKLRDESGPNAPSRQAAILATPNHEMITLLCEHFKFRWRMVAWNAMGIADWTGIHDYERDRRRTYVLDRL
jgi:SAM-dependent methyltransferase